MYYFLCASLPDLMFGKQSRLSVAAFDELCRGQVGEADFTRLTGTGLEVGSDPAESQGKPRVYAEMIRFEQYLRTRIAQRRAGREEDRAASLPDPVEYFSEVDIALAQAAAAADPAERERVIDRLRWRRLDDLEAGHEFDFDRLCVYRLRLAILDKYRDRRAEPGRENFNAAVERISQAAPATE